MTKFSLHGDEDNDQEGPSSRRPSKRLRFELPDSSNQPHSDDLYDVNVCFQVIDQEEEEEEEDNDDEEEEEESGSPLEIHSVPANPEPVVSNSDKSISACFTDPDVLDCVICFEPLTIPVYQCENGHIACSSCCFKIHNKCPSCSWPIGYNRCRAIEKVLESVKIVCQYKQYGCNETVIFSKKKEHEKNCRHSACLCPLTDCNFVSSYRQMYSHFRTIHSESKVQFSYNAPFNVELVPNAISLVLQEKNEGVLFILNQNSESYGNVVWLSCMSSPSTAKQFKYDVSAKDEGNSLALRSIPKSTQGKFDGVPPTGSLLVPSGFFRLLSNLYLRLCIFNFVPECSGRSHNEG